LFKDREFRFRWIFAISLEGATGRRDQERQAMQGAGGNLESVREILELTETYFDMLYSSDTKLADRVFHGGARLCTMERELPVFRSLEDYKHILRERPPPKSVDAPRDDRLISLDLASAATALVKVEMRVNAMLIVDYLSMMKLETGWRIVAKTYHRLQG
jgi:hypothetical protein